jgi:hypothetical protein
MTKSLAQPSAPERANQTILSGSRTRDGVSENAATIPAIDPVADRRSDSVGQFSDPPPAAPPARTSRRGFLMNSMVSAASLTTAAAVAAPRIASAAPAADTVSFPDLVARFLPLRDRWKVEELDSELDKVNRQLMRIATAMVNQPAKSVCDLGWQAEAIVTWADDLETIEDGDDAAERMLKTLVANIRSLARPLPMVPGSVPAAESVDPIFASIAAHRKAYRELEKAIKAADVKPDRRTQESARIVVGSKDPGVSSTTKSDDGGWTVTWTPTGRQEPAYASSPVEIMHNCPADLQGAAKRAWIADRNAELESAKQEIAKRRARTKVGKLEAARDEAQDLERERMWDLIWIVPTTADGLAALLSYSRERGSINELVYDDAWEDALEWTIERAVCALAGLPTPPMGETVASLWKRL